MSFNKVPLKITLIPILISVIIIEIIIFYFNPFQPKTLWEENFSALDRNYWLKMIKEAGGKQAYLEFKENYKNERLDIQHIKAHIFGELLYEVQHWDGIISCDTAFSFGCYHGLVSRAISTKGLSIVPDLDDKCSEIGSQGIGCNHGIGHGLVEYLGHKEEKLLTALEECSKLNFIDKLLACSSGVFMEYNFPIEISADKASISIRKMTLGNPYDICLKIPEKYKIHCYFSAPQWWIETFNNSDYTYFGKLCQGIQNNEHQEKCFLGLGYFMVQDGEFSVQKIIDQCDQMPEKNGMVTCRSGAYWIAQASPLADLSEEICNSLDSKEAEICLKDTGLARKTAD